MVQWQTVVPGDRGSIFGRNRPTYISLADLEGGEGGYGGYSPPYQSSKIKQSNKTKQNRRQSAGKGRREKESCMFVLFLCEHALISVSTILFLSTFSSSPPPPFESFLDPRLCLQVVTTSSDGSTVKRSATVRVSRVLGDDHYKRFTRVTVGVAH